MTLQMFWTWVDIKSPEHCWLWKGAITKRDSTGRGGYGKANIDGRTRCVHVVAFELSRNKTVHLNICHTCDVRHCCNPQHLFEGTSKDNTADAARKLRLVHKLTVEQAKWARQAKIGEFGKLANILGVSKQAVSAIAHRRNWKYLDEVYR